MVSIDPSSSTAAVALHGTASSREIERTALQAHPPMTLMNRAGAAVARLALALLAQPGSGAQLRDEPGAARRLQAREVTVVVGRGANGGDGWVAARHLHAAGLPVRVWEPMGCRSTDAGCARQEALAAGVRVQATEPEAECPAPCLVIDALFGLGYRVDPAGAPPPQAEQAKDTTEPADPGGAAMAWIHRQSLAGSTVLAVDLPSGLDGQTGSTPRVDPSNPGAVRADHTLSLLTLKPGLYTHQGRSAAGRIWFDDLGCAGFTQAQHPGAWLAAGTTLQALLLKPRFDPRQGWRHAGHKGVHGDTWVVGGAPGMGGAAVLAARAALAAGAGRVHLMRLDNLPADLGDAGRSAPREASPCAARGGDPAWPELMSADADALLEPGRWNQATVVAGCGGGSSIAARLAPLLHHAARLVLDADALNALAADPGLQDRLRRRGARGLRSILTPHPLEAARLLGSSVQAVQSDRLAAAQELAARLGATVVLKGSGTVTATAGLTPWINGSGNARLSTAGTGDVLAGWMGGAWKSGDDPHTLAAACVELHGRAADRDDSGFVLRAGRLIEQMALQLAGAAHRDDS